jgi:CRP/FNR family transcriptional regulator
MFSHLSPAQLQRIEEISLLRHFSAGEIIFYQGDESHYFHFLLAGDVTVSKYNDVDKIELHRFRAPALVAEMASLKSIPFPATAEALSECDILKISRDPFIELIQHDGGLALSLIGSLLQKINSLQRLTDQLSAPDAMAKIVRLMFDSPEIFKHSKGIEIAKMAGTTPETFSRLMTKLKREQLIVYKPRHEFDIINISELNKYR